LLSSPASRYYARLAMQISLHLADIFFEILRRNAPADSEAATALADAQPKPYGPGSIYTVRCSVAVAQDLQLLAAQLCPKAVPVIASVLAQAS
jgi:hypothetical protein